TFSVDAPATAGASRSAASAMVAVLSPLIKPPRVPCMAPERVVDAFVAALPDGAGRRLATGEWGVTLEPGAAGAWPLDIGLPLADGLLCIQAFAVPAAAAPADADVLHWN